MITVFASSSSPPSTVTLPSFVSEPSPSSTSILFFFIRLETPPVIVFTTLSRWLVTPLKSISGPPFTLTPKSFAWRTSSTMSATRSTALAGMQA